MAQKLSAISALMLTNAAATATAIAGATTTAEVQSLARILTSLATRPDLLIPAVQLSEPGAVKEVLIG